MDKIAWLNTQVAGSIAYHGVTGTYSFNNNDADGAAGVTISTYEGSGKLLSVRQADSF